MYLPNVTLKDEEEFDALDKEEFEVTRSLSVCGCVCVLRMRMNACCVCVRLRV